MAIESSSQNSIGKIYTKHDFSISLRRKIVKWAFILTITSFTIIILLPLFSILISVLSNGIPLLLNEFPNFFTTRTKNPNATSFGLHNALWGSIMLIVVACIIGIPIGILAGIYLAETRENRYTWFVRLVADVLQSTPSIVAGLVIFTFWVLPQGGKYGGLAGGMALAILMIPIITRTTEEAIRTVPTTYREAAYALGIPQWRITLSIVVKTSLPIILAGVMIAVARIAGETAPLLFTTLDTNFYGDLSSPTANLPVKIFKYSTSPFLNTWIPSAWAMATTLLILVFTINLLVRTNFITGGIRFTRSLFLKIRFYR